MNRISCARPSATLGALLLFAAFSVACSHPQEEQATNDPTTTPPATQPSAHRGMRRTHAGPQRIRTGLAAAAPSSSDSAAPQPVCGKLATPDGKPTSEIVKAESGTKTSPTIHTGYPKFTLDCVDASTIVDAAIANDIDARTKAFTDAFAKSPAAQQNAASWSLAIACSPAHTSSKLVSLACIQSIAQGTPKMQSSRFAFSFAVDGAKARVLTLDDLLAPGKRADFVAKVVAAINDGKKGKAGSKATDAVTVDKALGIFVLDDTMLEVMFDAGVVGAPSEGDVTIRLDYPTLKDLLRSDGPVSSIAH